MLVHGASLTDLTYVYSQIKEWYYCGLPNIWGPWMDKAIQRICWASQKRLELGLDLLLSLVNWEVVAAQNWRQKSWKKKKKHQFIPENILNIFGFENNTLRTTFFWFFSTCDIINYTKGENISSRHNFVLEWAGSSVSCRARTKSDCFVVFLFHIWDLERPIFDHGIINSWAMGWVTTIEKRWLSGNSLSKYVVTYSQSFVFMFIIVYITNHCVKIISDR